MMSTDPGAIPAGPSRAEPVEHITREGEPEECARMWAVVKQHYGDELCENPQSGETWQYMGTYITCGLVCHEFRHRDLPDAGRTLFRVPRIPPPDGVPHGWEVTRGTPFRAAPEPFVPKAAVEVEVGRPRTHPCAWCGAKTSVDARLCASCKQVDDNYGRTPQ